MRASEESVLAAGLAQRGTALADGFGATDWSEDDASSVVGGRRRSDKAGVHPQGSGVPGHKRLRLVLTLLYPATGLEVSKSRKEKYEG